MKRQLPWIVVGLIALLVAAALLRRQPAVSTSSDAEVNTEGHFASDSLGVSLFLPDSPGWSFRREPAIPNEPYMSAVHEGENAIVKLYASRTTPGIDLDEWPELRILDNADSTTIALSICELLSSADARRRVIEQQYEFVCRYFRADVVAGQYLQAFAELMA